ncbi:MAG: hypothetical protein H0X30_06275 [Anaerolineae bacterium]|nr:hypothetical protein [Anaerolineae bacterium]
MRWLARFSMICLAVVLLLLVGAQMVLVSPALAATIDKIDVSCRFVSVQGKTEVNAPYVRVQVALASDLTRVIAQQVVPTRPRRGADYKANLDIRRAHLADGTMLVISVGEWDGTHYLRPATITSAECGHASTPAPTPTLVGSATLPLTFTPTFVASPTFIMPPTPTPIASPSFPPVSPTPPPTPRPR